ncbi:Na+/H+ antiporter NhaA [Tabrizicola sp.]|uniref:Na+/H+ antiporter NhaA n=1 Tax=Tabrizicola sp. TaxID=2005166 RepID=UPI002735B5FD|nr:Na+/H+ antiporter NhaA [Tabrizicola sp.]MDP3196289.1 Na+/H+ antiporter NhaA [Tabrizicola sp.]
MYRVSSFVPRFAKALIGGAALATLWVNLAPASYYDSIEWRLVDLPLPGWIVPLPVSLTPLNLVADAAMSLFLFFIGKELWEALRLEHGALKGRQALLPAGLTLGGIAGAALMWILVGSLIETAEEAGFATGWQVPLGSDVVLCFLIGRAVFGPGHPALHLLLLLSIATDILALLISGLTQPAVSLRLVWLLLPLVAALATWTLFGRTPDPTAPETRRQSSRRLLPYVIACLLSWIGVAASGLPPVLGLLPVIPAIAHADRSFGLFAEAEELLHDPLNRLAHALAWPLTGVLFLFGLTRGGVDLSAFAPTTLTTLAALWLGRPLGMILIGLGLAAALGLRLPAGVTLRDVLRITLIMAMGFTVPVLSLATALPGGAMQEAARLGLALSLLAGPAALLLASRRL